MKEVDYFVKNEQTHKGEKAMIIMDIKADNFYAFKNFHMNMSYPKKIVDSTIESEYLEERPNFRYKKVNIIMGGNATGKTSIGRLLMRFANYLSDGECSRFVRIINDSTKTASMQVDFVTDKNILYRFSLSIAPEHNKDTLKKNINAEIYFTEIGSRDNYEMCAKRLDDMDCELTTYDELYTRGWHFIYPPDSISDKTYYSVRDDERYLKVLEQVLQTLDPSVKSVIKLQEVDNTYAIKIGNKDVLIQDGEISDTAVLSSGTKAGLDISYVIASLICKRHSLYYCDELFSYVNSDVEKACLSITIGRLTGRRQLFFTTHNTDILDMQLPKHSFTFLKKDVCDEEQPIKCINAGQYLKRNTDSLKHAVENDLFSTAPELEKLYAIEEL